MIAPPFQTVNLHLKYEDSIRDKTVRRRYFTDFSVTIAQIQLKWSTLQKATLGLSGLMADIQLSTEKYTHKKNENAFVQNSRSGFEQLYKNAVRRHQQKLKSEMRELTGYKNILSTNKRYLTDFSHIKLQKKSKLKTSARDSVIVPSFQQPALPSVSAGGSIDETENIFWHWYREVDKRLALCSVLNDAVIKDTIPHQPNPCVSCKSLIKNSQTNDVNRYDENDRKHDVKTLWDYLKTALLKCCFILNKPLSSFLEHYQLFLIRNVARRAYASCVLLCCPCSLALADLPSVFEFSDGKYRDPLVVKQQLDARLKLLSNTARITHDVQPMPKIKRRSPHVSADSNSETESECFSISNRSLPQRVSLLPSAHVFKKRSGIPQTAVLTEVSPHKNIDSNKSDDSPPFRQRFVSCDSLPGEKLSIAKTNQTDDSNDDSYSDTSLTVSILEYASSLSSNDDIEETHFHSLKDPEVSTDSIWEPRLILYGGALQRDTTSASRATTDLHECYMYTLTSEFFDNEKASEAELNDGCVFKLDTSSEENSNISFNWNEAKVTSSTPDGRYGSAHVVYRGRLYIFGGAGENQWRQPVLMNDLWMLSYDVKRSSYCWKEIEMKSSSCYPPPCAFHLASTHAGYLYTIIHRIERCTTRQTKTMYSLSKELMTSTSDYAALILAELERSKAFGLKTATLETYIKHLSQEASISSTQLWRIDLETAYPEWEKIEMTVSKNLPELSHGGLALTCYAGRLFYYGALTEDPQVAIGVFDLNLKMWIAWIQIPNGPICVSAVPVGKLWFFFGQETWGIFNFETFEWRCERSPSKATIRYGCSAVWLPPYLPFPGYLNQDALSYVINTPHRENTNLMHSTDVAAQYFWLLQQQHRQKENEHRILLIGGFDCDGLLCNQIDIITITLPEDLILHCFSTLSPDADLLYASLFGLKLKDERLYGREVVLYKKGEVLQLRERLSKRDEHAILCSLLSNELAKLKLRFHSVIADLTKFH